MTRYADFVMLALAFAACGVMALPLEADWLLRVIVGVLLLAFVGAAVWAGTSRAKGQ